MNRVEGVLRSWPKIVHPGDQTALRPSVVPVFAALNAESFVKTYNTWAAEEGFPIWAVARKKETVLN